MEYLVIFEKGPTSWGAYVPDLPGCVAAGESQEEVRKLIESAIELHLRGMREDGDPIPEPTAVAAGFVNAAQRPTNYHT
jgi:predicted RNase H-like HicB family nuclease